MFVRGQSNISFCILKQRNLGGGGGALALLEDCLKHF